MARRRNPTPATIITEPSTGTPLWLQVGPLCEIFSVPGAPGGPLLSAFSRHAAAVNSWSAATGRDGGRTACGPWSVHDPGGLERLARHGLLPSDLPELRLAASAYIPDERTR